MTVLIGYVPTPRGEAALTHGLAEAGVRGTDVVILHSPSRESSPNEAVLDEAAEAALLRRAEEAGVVARLDRTFHDADLVATFVDRVQRSGADLVVIGLRRRTPVGKFILGSAAQRLLLEIDVPVMAVKP